MEARFFSAALAAVSLSLMGASHRTASFIVSAPTPQLAREICDAAEQYRRDLAYEWLGRELPPWSGPCPITVHVGPRLGAGGVTSFMFDHGRPYGWRMRIQGSRQRILDSVLPHEITHTIFATHFGRPLPRWADEGASTTVEHVSEKAKQQRNLITFLTTGHGISFNRMFAMKEYPADVLPLYAQGHSVAKYLITQGGKRRFVNYVGEGMQTNNWTTATQKHYGFKDLSELQVTWLDWVRHGQPPVKSRIAPAGSSPRDMLLAQGRQPRAHGRRPRPKPNLIYRGQSIDSLPTTSGRLVAVAPQDTQAERGQAPAAAQSWYDRVPRNIPPANSIRRSVTRPPAPRRPRQIILQQFSQPRQWRSAILPSGGTPAVPIFPPNTSYGMPQAIGGTILR